VVKIALPESGRPPRDPLFHVVARGTQLFRIFDPTAFGASALGFRHYGPLHRFDHHVGIGPPTYAPSDDPIRGVYYAAFTLSGCLVEVFGDDGSITVAERRVAKPDVIRDLRLLDLRGVGAMRAGSVAALAKVADRSLSQAWSRYFYESIALFGLIDGIIYANAHNDEDAVVLVERAADALVCRTEMILRLDDPALRPFLEETAIVNNLVFL
jgi:hypothetical protein